jgi:hypothetical protein
VIFAHVTFLVVVFLSGGLGDLRARANVRPEPRA